MTDEALPFGDAALRAFEEFQRFRAEAFDELAQALIVDLVAHGSAAFTTDDDGEQRKVDPADLRS